MDLLLLRHADANTEAATDDDRKLSDKGIGQAKKVGRFCKEHDIQPEIILTSPIRRAKETADIVAEQFGTKATTVPWLACGMQPEKALAELAKYAKHECVMIVGHQPDLSMLIATLLDLPHEEQIHVRKASLTRLECAAFARRSACLQWSVPCRLM